MKKLTKRDAIDKEDESTKWGFDARQRTNENEAEDDEQEDKSDNFNSC